MESHGASRYRLYPLGGHPVNLQSDAEDAVDDFEVVGEADDVDVW